MRNLIETSTIAPTMSSSSSYSPATTLVQRSPWHSPVPYLFGGLAAMLGLIAFALLILACSYWKLSSATENDGDVENQKGDDEKVVRMYEEKIVVIMAGDEKPTYLATPVCSRGSSFGDDSRNSGQSQEMNDEEKLEKTKEDQAVVIQIPVISPIAEENANSEEGSSMATAAPATNQSEENQ